MADPSRRERVKAIRERVFWRPLFVHPYRVDTHISQWRRLASGRKRPLGVDWPRGIVWRRGRWARG